MTVKELRKALQYAETQGLSDAQVQAWDRSIDDYWPAQNLRIEKEDGQIVVRIDTDK